MENWGEKGKKSWRGEKEKQAYKSNYLPTINKIPLGLRHTSHYIIFGKLSQCSLTTTCISFSSHPSHALSKWTKKSLATEGREEEGPGGGPMRHHGRVQCLLPVPPSNKSTPHITGLCCTRMSLCFLCSLLQKPFTPPKVSSFALRSASVTQQFTRSTAVQFHFNNSEFMFVPPLIFNSWIH